MNLEELLARLIATGEILDADAARRRIQLGYPPWLVLQEMPLARILAEISQASGLPLAPRPLSEYEIDVPACEEIGVDRLLERRWLPLADGSVAIANPFGIMPDAVLAGRPLLIASSESIDRTIEVRFPNAGSGLRNRRRLGRFLLDSQAVTEQGLVDALAEQRRNGGRLGNILLAHGIVEPAQLTEAVAQRVGLTAVRHNVVPVPMLPRAMAHEFRAVAIEGSEGPIAEVHDSPVQVAFADPSEEAIEEIAAYLGRPIEPKITDEETLDTLLAGLYASDDVEAVVEDLYEQQPEMSAFKTNLSTAQLLIAAGFVLILLSGLAIDAWFTAILTVAIATGIYVVYALYRLYSAWKGWRIGSILNPTADDLALMDGRDLPSYTVLLPVFREKPETLRPLFEGMANLDYPKQKLNGLLLVEADDKQTKEALEFVERSGEGVRPRWLKVLFIPPGEPRTKPKAMIYALLYSTGDMLTIFDAEDKPEPDQLKKAAWAFKHSPDDVVCIQAKLSYYNSRQNLLTRWFTLEYAAWFDLFLPGLHAMKAPIPLGGTSNHFKLDVLKQVMSWDPYNVTEDADLGLRFTRNGYRTQMLESTTLEEANSNFKNWIRQRSRWIKGYMQTFLVHTRDPIQLYRELGFVNCIHFLATVGGLIYTVLISPLFWALLIVWLIFQPGWIPELFPGPVYYLAMVSLVFGNFLFMFLALIGAVGRGQDDLAPYTLIFPIYWMMMSIAAYMGLYELIRKPHYWQKTEHGLHVKATDATKPASTTTPASPDAQKAA